MKNILTAVLVSLIMIIGILAITNPGRKQYQMFDKVEGKLSKDYFIFSIYQQYGEFTLTADGKYRVYRRFLGIALNLYEISSEKVKIE